MISEVPPGNYFLTHITYSSILKVFDKNKNTSNEFVFMVGSDLHSNIVIDIHLF